MTDNTQIQSTDSAEFWLMPAELNKDKKSQIKRYIAYLDDNGIDWGIPDLAEYRDHLFNEGLSASTVSAHLSNIRSQYKALLRDNNFHSFLLNNVSDFLRDSDNNSLADSEALISQIIRQIENAINPKNAPVTTIKQMDEADHVRTRLTVAQIFDLLQQPYRVYGNDNIRVEREVALISVWVGMGLRREEAANLKVEDLDRRLGGELALEIREGKGGKQRLVPYGANIWVLKPIRKWLDVAGITSGYIFRGTYRGNKKFRPGRISLRTLDRILEKFTIEIDGKLRGIQGHDLRASYARIMYDNGMQVEGIAYNMGHTHANGTPNTKQTWRYIGVVGVEYRVPQKGIPMPDFMK